MCDKQQNSRPAGRLFCVLGETPQSASLPAPLSGEPKKRVSKASPERGGAPEGGGGVHPIYFSRNSFAGMALENQKPWALSQPTERMMSTCSRVSMPSQMT